MNLAANTMAFTPASILAAIAGLIAFHIGLLTLVGRERKSPYVINSAFAVFIVCLVVAAIAVVSAITQPPLQEWALQVSSWGLFGAICFSLLNVYRVMVRFKYFIDSLSWKHFPIIRWLRQIPKIWSRRPNYAHDPVPIDKDLNDELLGILTRHGDLEIRDGLEPKALALALNYQGHGNRLFIELALAFLKRQFLVQILSASRHPYEFIVALKEQVTHEGLSWPNVVNLIQVVDAYSPHFGFTDSIYRKKDIALDALNVHHLRSQMTFAGMHSATSRAFNQASVRKTGAPRQPTLVIYEDCYALSDLESPEQYRVFVRHVLPSERAWDGMFTVFAETAQSDAEWKVLQAHVSLVLDLRKPAPSPQGDTSSRLATPSTVATSATGSGPETHRPAGTQEIAVRP